MLRRLLCLNRYLLSGYGFRQPVFLTFWHMVCCCLCTSLCTAMPWYEAQPVRTWLHLGKIALLASVFTFSVVGGNISLKYVPVSFNQARPSAAPKLVTFERSRRQQDIGVRLHAVGLALAI